MLVVYEQANFAETIRQLASTWRSMSDEEKNRYRDAAKQSGAGRRAQSGTSSTGSRPTSVSLVKIRLMGMTPEDGRPNGENFKRA